MDHIIGGVAARTMYETDVIDDEVLDNVEAAIERGGFSATQLDMIANPGEHPSIL